MLIDDFVKILDKDRAMKYKEYWMSIKPENDADKFKRWVFALCSIRTTWKQNVIGYQALTKDLNWMLDHSLLESTIKSTKIGLTKIRTRSLWEISRHYINNPSLFSRTNESWAAHRDRLSAELFGIGKAKTAFALEMIYPEEVEVACLDTHILKSLGWSKRGTPSDSEYNKLESQWLDKCKSLDLPSAIVRHMYWDKLHNQSDTRYWSHCLERA